MGKWTPKAKPDILFSRVETAGEMKYVFNARPHLLSSPPRRGNSYWPVLDLQMTVRQILSRDFSRRWRTIHLLLEEKAGMRADVCLKNQNRNGSGKSNQTKLQRSDI
jgi:hypothetical protein